MSPTALAPISLSPRVVVFDYGEVISREPSGADRAALLARAGVEPGSGTATGAFWSAYWAHRDGLDRGTTSIADYWRAVALDLGVEWSEIDVHELWAIDHRGWLSVDPGTLAVVHALAAGGTRLALLSNAGADYAGWLRHGSFAPLFERVFVSGELRLVKPDAEIYEHVIDELGIQASDLLFVDNKSENVEGARAVGGDGHVFTDASGLERWLRSLA
ncbi:HAD family phosphatase [Agromyces sp. H3Y2-19a]|jgi:putative hydrolase of the HAD superfamily|uniref:HAD family hydrolase n=1 Tax=Agromyces TaxID=33877 RepID=UPI0023B93584|nr:HAD family phosphatase [Agromyces chromiiresistens]MDF0514710.1 HAD family phosphatase [Agromyces chromiiresistens]